MNDLERFERMIIERFGEPLVETSDMLSSRDRNAIADAYETFLASGSKGLTSPQLFERGVRAADWAIEQLLKRGMIVRLTNVPGKHSVESRYVAKRNAPR